MVAGTVGLNRQMEILNLLVSNEGVEMLMTNHNLFFMYGSNLNPDRLRDRAPNWDGKYHIATLAGYELRFNKLKQDGTAAANVIPHRIRKVYGAIVELIGEDLKEVDRHEGYPKHYDRLQLKVTLEESGDLAHPYIYTAKPTQIHEELLPSSDYLKHVIKGMKFCSLPLDYTQAIERLGSRRE